MADEDNDEMDVEATPVPTPAPTSYHTSTPHHNLISGAISER